MGTGVDRIGTGGSKKAIIVVRHVLFHLTPSFFGIHIMNWKFETNNCALSETKKARKLTANMKTTYLCSSGKDKNERVASGIEWYLHEIFVFYFFQNLTDSKQQITSRRVLFHLFLDLYSAKKFTRARRKYKFGGIK